MEKDTNVDKNTGGKLNPEDEILFKKFKAACKISRRNSNGMKELVNKFDEDKIDEIFDTVDNVILLSTKIFNFSDLQKELMNRLIVEVIEMYN